MTDLQKHLTEFLKVERTQTEIKKELKRLKVGYELSECGRAYNKFDIYLTLPEGKTARIYKPMYSKLYILQVWNSCKFVYSGTPTFFATDSIF